MIDTNCSINKREAVQRRAAWYVMSDYSSAIISRLGDPQEKKRYSIIMCILQDNQWANSLPEWATANPLITRGHKWFTCISTSIDSYKHRNDSNVELPYK